MTEHTYTLESLKQHRDALVEMVALKDAAIRLSQNPDFNKVIMQQFAIYDAAHYVAASCDPALSAEQRADALVLAQAAGHLKRWLSVQVQRGSVAQQDVEDANIAIAESEMSDEVE